MRRVVGASCAVLAWLALSASAHAQEAGSDAAGGDTAGAGAPMLAEPALPATPGVFDLHPGTPVVRRAGGAEGPVVEVFQFVAGVGARATLDVSGPGPVVLTVYTPEGAQMLVLQGQGSASIALVAPRDGIYYASVARRDAATAYVVELAVAQPAFYDAVFADDVGYMIHNRGLDYGYSCWMDNGKTRRTYVFDNVVDLVYAGNGAGREVWHSAGGYPPRTFTLHMEGNEVVRQYSDGLDLRYVPFAAERGAYHGYYCEAR